MPASSSSNDLHHKREERLWDDKTGRRTWRFRVCPSRPEANETGNQKDICYKQTHTSDRPTSSPLYLSSYHCVTVATPVKRGGFVSVSVSKPDWPSWMRIIQTGWRVVYSLVLFPFIHWFSAHISEDSSSSVAPEDVLWQRMREKAVIGVQGWAKRSFQRRLQEGGGHN